MSPAAKTILRYIADRAKEPTTMIGLSVLGALFGIPPGIIEGVGKAIAVAGAVGGVLLPESK